MSYEIIYGKQFIKLTADKIIPILYWGSNNCYEPTSGGRMRRERDFTIWKFLSNNNLFATPQELMESTARYRQELIDRHKDDSDENKYDDSRFGYFSAISIGGSTHRTTFKNLENVVKSGINGALLVEEILQTGAEVKFYCYEYQEGDFLKNNGVNPINARPKTSQELIELIELAEKTLPKGSYSVRIDARDSQVKRLRAYGRPQRVKRQKERKELPYFYAILCKSVGGYLLKFTKNGYRYSPYDTGGKKFENEKKALNYLGSRMPGKFEAIKIDKPIIIFA